MYLLVPAKLKPPSFARKDLNRLQDCLIVFRQRHVVVVPQGINIHCPFFCKHSVEMSIRLCFNLLKQPSFRVLAQKEGGSLEAAVGESIVLPRTAFQGTHVKALYF